MVAGVDCGVAFMAFMNFGLISCVPSQSNISYVICLDSLACHSTFVISRNNSSMPSVVLPDHLKYLILFKLARHDGSHTPIVNKF